MKLEYIIVQAGGKGTRMKYLTKNKPKCLVPINNLPMLFHLFKKYPDKKFIIIGDYKYEVLDEYLKAFAEVKYILVDARGFQGTCSGLKKALTYIPKKKRFMLIWSDLILPQSFTVPEDDKEYVGISKDFSCRWSYKQKEFIEELSEQYGVAGLFIFNGKESIIDVPQEGEFVRWLKMQGKTNYGELALYGTKEYGLLSVYEKSVFTQKCRPFNRIEEIDGKIKKEGIDEQGKKLATIEKEWYQIVQTLGYNDIPPIYSFTPFIMGKICGKNIYEYESVSKIEKKKIIEKCVENLKTLHQLKYYETDHFSMKEAYFTKTMERLSKIRNLIPFANQEIIYINGRNCKNVFFYQKEFETKVMELECIRFELIHGDCTFSNMMLKNDEHPILIDPRGYFGYTKTYGDPDYDWAKLYYSIVGNYDQFNLKRFELIIEENEIVLNIKSNGFEDLESDFFELLPEVNIRKIKLIHAIIWLSLTTYAWEDYDSICASFYNGLFYLQEIWD